MAAEGLTTRARDAVTVAAFKGAWWGVRALPERAAHRLFDVIADVTTRRGGPSVARMRS
ncbi:MAG: phosphatidylinositol mannoside acyltransferase, partial [Dermacoccus nishinomiyaensis]